VVATGAGAELDAPHPLDVACVLKRWVADQAPCQAPVLVLPFLRMSRLPALPVALRARLPPKHSKEWLDLAESLLNLLGTVSATVTARYLIQLARGQLGGVPPDMPFHRDGRPAVENAVLALLRQGPALTRQLLPVAAFKAAIQA
jgi:hypothetical protein